MTKKKAIFKFILICVLTVLGVVACFVEFRVPTTATRFKSLMGAIEDKMGIDLKGGVLVVYRTEPNTETGVEGSYDQQIQATIERLGRTLTEKNYGESTVVRQGDKIRVEVPGMQDTKDFFDAIGEPANLNMRKELGGDPFLTSKHVKSVEYYQDQNYQHGVKVNFTDEGGRLFQEVASTANLGVTKIYIYLDEEMISDPVVNSSDAGANNTTVIKGDYTKAEAERFRTKIESGLFEVKLSIDEEGTIPPTLGEGALTAGIIAVIVGLLFIFILMYFLYGDLGLLSNLSMLIYTVLFIFALAIVDAVQLTLPGIAGIILSLGMAVDANIVIYERIKEEYKSGKRMAVSVESGFKKSTMTIVDSNVTTIIAAAVLYFLGEGAIKGFAITLFLGVVISMFCSLVLTRSFAKLYLYINGANAKRLKLKTQDDIRGRAMQVPDGGGEADGDTLPALMPTQEVKRKRVLNR
jgi:preprotein translocase subunit SecD